jgi:hypothetical protein
MIASPSDDPGLLSGLADTISANVNAGRSIGTNAPMVRVTADAASTGQSASLALGDPLTIATTDGAVDVTVEVQSPTWAQFDRIELYVNSTTTRTMSNKETGNGPVSVKRYAITPDVVQTAPADFTVVTVPVPGTASSRLEAITTALAFTNPLFIDVDGGGWTAPGVQIVP